MTKNPFLLYYAFMVGTSGMSVKAFRAWRAFHKLRGQLLPHLSKNISKNTGLYPSDFFLLITLIDSPRSSLHSSEIADRLDWEKSRVSHQISRVITKHLADEHFLCTEKPLEAVSVKS